MTLHAIPTPLDPPPLAERVDAICTGIIAARAITFMAVWETPDGVSHYAVAPDSPALAVGLVEALGRAVRGDEVEEL